VAACGSCGYASPAPFRFCPECGTERVNAAAAGAQRRTVTVVFCDLAGSTALGESIDPERLRALLARYFEEMRSIVERHGGTVEKFIGDAVMAVFGVPTVHEDDALRAVRAAVEMRDAVPELGLEGRIGVMTGEVVTGTSERLVTGDAVNVAARLEQAAAPGQVLIGDPTLELVRDAVEVESLEPVRLKGKTAPLTAHLLRAVREAPERRHDAPFVGRQPELAALRDAWERVAADRCCELVTVVGEAGVGKSRLVAEALAALETRVVRGRCLPYGEGITYWPVVEVLKQLDAEPPDDAAAAAIRSLLGENDVTTSAEEIAWAFRKTLEHAAAEAPLVVVLDDIQWGERTFHDLVEHVALLSTGVPILLVCMARPELTERRGDWPVTLRLSPLDDADVELLIPERVAGELRRRITHAAGGNPLFVTEMLAMATAGGGDVVVVPRTLHALLAARLDQLEPSERRVLEHAAVEGEIFHRGAVQALASHEGASVTPRLAALVRKQLIRPDRPQLAGEDGFRFCHLLIRDTAYEALPKSARAGLHERLASWLEQHATALVERDELVGYHLEQACRYRAELGLPSSAGLVHEARRRLATAGRRALRRHDYAAAVNFLERAASLAHRSAPDLPLACNLIDALLWSGRPSDALTEAETLARRAREQDDRIGERCGLLKAAMLRASLQSGGPDAVTALVDEALPLFTEAADDLALYTAYCARGWAADFHAQNLLGFEAYERAAEHARRAGLPDEQLAQRAANLVFGPTPASDVLTWIDDNEPRDRRDYWLSGSRAQALAMLGRFREAREIIAQARSDLLDRGGGLELALLSGFPGFYVEQLAGEPARAAALGEEGCRLLEDVGDRGYLSTAAGQLALALYALGRYDDAEAQAARAAEIGSRDDVWTQMLWRRARAKVLARRGDHAEAAGLVRDAVALSEGTDGLDAQGDAYADLGDVLVLGGELDDAAAAFGQALERYERKGNLVMAERTRKRLDPLLGSG
jgi:class 3 adenylate cyclase/tetratricopeptide (TPR) repeat protein